MIKEIRVSIHCVLTSSVLLLQLVSHLILLISSFNPSILPPSLPTSSTPNFLFSHAHPPPPFPYLLFAPPLPQIKT